MVGGIVPGKIKEAIYIIIFVCVYICTYRLGVRVSGGVFFLFHFTILFFVAHCSAPFFHQLLFSLPKGNIFVSPRFFKIYYVTKIIFRLLKENIRNIKLGIKLCFTIFFK